MSGIGQTPGAREDLARAFDGLFRQALPPEAGDVVFSAGNVLTREVFDEAVAQFRRHWIDEYPARCQEAPCGVRLPLIIDPGTPPDMVRHLLQNFTLLDAESIELDAESIELEVEGWARRQDQEAT